MITSRPQLRPDEVVRHLYVHVPFCPTICPFCSFHVLERRSAAVERYLDGVDLELAQLAERCEIVPETIYFGGGTPSYLRPAEMERLGAAIRSRVGWGSTEVTLEVHPSTASAERVGEWADLGVTRFSVGAQSFDDAVLTTLGRHHSGDAGRRAVEWCLSSGLTTSVDIMTAIDGQDLAADLGTAAALGVDHVSAYTLTIEEGTPFEAGGVVVDNDVEAAAIGLAAELLEASGFERYEVSNYARSGQRCHHNQAYWRHRWFAGVGPSAASLLPLADGTVARWANAAMTPWLDGDPGAGEIMAPADLLGDALLCGLRLREGVDLDAVESLTGLDPRRELADELDVLCAEGLLGLDGSTLRATDAGYLVLDRVATALL